MLEKKMMRKSVAGCMAFVLSLALAWQPGVTEKADAASVAQTEYIGDIKVVTTEGGGENAAQEWCKSQPENTDADVANDWHVLPGDLNDGASGALKKDVGVYLVYQTTTDPEKAVTDLAVMNEKGNYSEAEYKTILEKQKELYKDMVSDMKDMLKEYRTNVEKKVPTALQAQKFMNGYIDDDSATPLGDLLLSIGDDDLVSVLMQANGRVVMMIQEKLAYACDNGKSTWLERMEKLGSFDKLRSKALTSYKNDATKADRALDNMYREKAVELSASWDDIGNHIRKSESYAEQQGINKMTDAEYKAWCEKTADDADANLYREEAAVISKLSTYKYENGTLVDYFKQDYKDVTDNNIKKLYPLVACLTTGQQAGVNETVSLFTLVLNASAASAFNDYPSGESKQIENKLSAEDKKEIEDTKASIDNTLDTWEENRITIYDGVDREVFKDGVAVTSAAKNYSNGVESSWVDAIVDSSYFRPAVIGAAVGAGLFATGAIISAVCYSKYTAKLMRDELSTVKKDIIEAGQVESLKDTGIFVKKTANEFKNEYDKVDFTSLIDSAYSSELRDQTAAGKQQLLEKALDRNPGNATKLKVLRGLKIGFTVATILLAVADIVVTSVSLYKYYNRDHLPIPHHMVDMSYNDNKETSFIAYKSVLDTDGKYGDLNGGGGKQWLALYKTYEKDAGNPILAPTGSGHEFVYRAGTNETPGTGYVPLHMFGTPNVAQNLTFADGESGYSYNDKKGGVYLYFSRANEVVTYTDNKQDETVQDEDDIRITEDGQVVTADDSNDTEAVSGSAVGTDQSGTAVSGGMLALIGVVGVLAGGFIGFVIADSRRKKMIGGKKSE